MFRTIILYSYIPCSTYGIASSNSTSEKPYSSIGRKKGLWKRRNSKEWIIPAQLESMGPGRRHELPPWGKHRRKVWNETSKFKRPKGRPGKDPGQQARWVGRHWSSPLQNPGNPSATQMLLWSGDKRGKHGADTVQMQGGNQHNFVVHLTPKSKNGTYRVQCVKAYR